MKNQRPLSPHLQIYRPQLTSILSILHRISGIIVALSSLLIAFWFWLLVSDDAGFKALNDFLGSISGQFLLLLWTLCTSYHLSNGIRHLFWDAGYGFNLDQTHFSGKMVIISTVILTSLVWLL